MKRMDAILIAASMAVVACRSGAPSRQGATKSVGASAPVPAMPIARSGGAAPADDKTVDPASRAGRLAAVQKDHRDFMNAYSKLLREAKTPEDRKQVVDANLKPDPQMWAPRFWRLVQEDPRDDVAFSALQWLIRNSNADEDKRRAYALLEKEQLGSPKLADFCDYLASDDSAPPGLMARILAESPHREVRGRAAFASANAKLQEIDLAGRVRKEADEEAVKAMKQRIGEERWAELARLDPAREQAEAEALLDRVVSEFGDVELRKSTLGERAKATLHEMRDLVVGKPAPEIQGEDLDGATFKLSDYRGKVVLLDFWGNW